jgi:hypothetical protein
MSDNNNINPETENRLCRWEVYHTGAVSYLLEGFGASGADFCIYTATEKVNFPA